MKYAYFPGCSVESAEKEYADSAKEVSKVLGIELLEIPDWNCCGSVDAVHSLNPVYSLALAARNLSLAERMQLDVTTLCTACYFALSRTNKMLKENSETKSKVDEALSGAGLKYSGNVKVRHFADVLLSDVGVEKLKENVKNSLSNLKVASYYGCLLVRPPDTCNFDNPEHPSRMETLVESLGASKVDYYGKTRCCGASLGVTDEKIMLKLSRDILVSAKNAGANCLITACPLCHLNLDAKQKDIESYFGVKINLPVLHFTQLIGLAFGLEPSKLGLQRNCVSPKTIIPTLVTEARNR